MPVVPGSHTVTGTVATTSEMNSFFRDPINFLLAPPIAELRQTVAQSLTNATFTAITFDTEDVDKDVSGAGGHSTSVNTSRFTAVYPGWYQVSGGVGFANNLTNVRITHIRVNGTTLNGSRQLMTAANSGINATMVPVRTKHVFLNVNDYVEVWAFQDSGGALNTDVNAETQSTMTVRWVSN